MTIGLLKEKRTTVNPIQERVKYLTGVIIIIGLLGACSGSKEYLDFGQVRNGNHLDKAREVPLDTFLTTWLLNTYPFKLDKNLNELYKDTLFTYFGKKGFKIQSLIKVKNIELNKLDYKSISGDSIRESFYNEIISLEDKQKSETKKCTSTRTDIDFKYKFIETNHIIEVRCHYKVNCGLFIGPRLVNSDYFAKYDIKNRTFIKN